MNFPVRPVRIVGPALLLAAAIAGNPRVAASSQLQDHHAALAALNDTRAAESELIQADASNSTDKELYHRASQRAINAIEGARGEHYKAGAGTPGDTQGAMGQVDALLDREGEAVWAAPLRSAEANLRVAVINLQDAGHARELMDYQVAVSRALLNLEMARGRPDQVGVFGGLEGVLATTVLGVPGDAQEADACAGPATAPAYGTHDGYLAWIAVPASSGDHQVPEPFGVSNISVANNFVVLHTAAASLVAKSCAGVRPAAQITQQGANASPPTSTAPESEPSAARPKLYTEAQAQAGKQIFGSKCVSCHGANLQGVAAPAVAGNDFLQTAEQDEWTVGIIRYIVFNTMPKNEAKSLSPEQYADVMAYLLASNCYPAGNTPFPTGDQPDLRYNQAGAISQAPPRSELKWCLPGRIGPYPRMPLVR